MTSGFTTFLRDLAEPVKRAEKFLWAELPGDQPQTFGKSLDMKARIRQLRPRSFELTLIARDQTELVLGPFRSLPVAKRRAEMEYSSWIKKTAIIEEGVA